jgi:hypothetical protein
MASKPPARTPLAGGALIALGAIGGSIVGLFQYQPTLGFLIGTGLGVAISIALWLFNVRR